MMIAAMFFGCFFGAQIMLHMSHCDWTGGFAYYQLLGV